jgi:hypothetical protein
MAEKVKKLTECLSVSGETCCRERPEICPGCSMMNRPIWAELPVETREFNSQFNSLEILLEICLEIYD